MKTELHLLVQRILCNSKYILVSGPREILIYTRDVFDENWDFCSFVKYILGFFFYSKR